MCRLNELSGAGASGRRKGAESIVGAWPNLLACANCADTSTRPMPRWPAGGTGATAATCQLFCPACAAREFTPDAPASADA